MEGMQFFLDVFKFWERDLMFHLLGGFFINKKTSATDNDY
jgi:hypothetical protein